MNHFSKNGRNPILIVDKEGILGDKLSQELAQRFVVVYVGQKGIPYGTPQSTDGSENIIFSEYGKSVPIIPNGNYSRMLVVDNGTRTTGFLSEFIKKARKDKSELIFIVSLFNASSFYNSYKKIKIKVQDVIKIIIFGELFDENIHLPFIETAIKDQIIQVNGDGLSKSYPVFLADAVSGIIDAVFSEGSLFYLFPKYPPTEISLARMIQKANPTVQVDFIKSRSGDSGDPRSAERLRNQILKQVQDDRGSGKYLLPDNYFLEKRIRELKIENLSIENNTKKNVDLSLKRQDKHMSIGWLLLFLFFLILLPLISTMFFSFWGFVILGYVKTSIETGNLSSAQRATNLSRASFNLADKTSDLLLLEAKIIGQESILDPIMKKISLGKDLSLASSYTLEASGLLSKVFIGKSVDPKEDFTKGTGLLRKVTILFRQNEASQEIPKDIFTKVKSMDGAMKIIENTIDVLPSLFGFDGKKTYLILFQNNMELRPTGGFIGSYGLLTIDSGRIEDFSIHDVYDADGQLKEHVEPPYPIRRYLGLVHWYLRDSNFDVDFAKSAQSAALLLDKELGKKVDGAIGVDVSFVKNILEAIGEVYVSDYRQTVNSDNLYEITQSHAEKNFFPGSRQKRNFLSSLFNSIQLNIGTREDLPYLPLVKNIARSISEKHLLFAFNDKYVQDIFTVNGWSSTLLKEPKDASVLGVTEEGLVFVNDFLGINEANLGVNKANFFVKRKLSHNVNLDEQVNISETIKLEYDNSSSRWPGGDYLNYLRLILPLNTTLLSISFDGIPQELVSAVTDFRVYEAENFVEPLGLEVEKYDQDGKTIYGFIVNIEAGKGKSIEIKYSLSQKISPDLTPFSYNLRLFKQPGTDNYPYSFSLIHPKHLKIIDGLDSFSENIEGDKDVSVSFTKR